MNYAIIDGNTITAHGTAKQLWPDVSFPRTGPNAEYLATVGAVEIRRDPPHDRETHYLQATEPYLLGGVVYDRAVVERPPAIPEPQWIAFGNAVMAEPGINVMLGAALQVAPALYGGLTVGLGKAADGDARVFVGAWAAAVGAGLVSVELIATMQAMATTYDLPAEFVAGLDPEPVAAET